LPSAILLVAGPSGAGKSTFIQCLKDGTLPPEIVRMLPPAAGRWQVYEANDFLKRNIAVGSVTEVPAPDGGIVLHFDIAFGRRLGVTDYANDPVMHLIRVPGELVVVNLQPSAERLRAQYEARLREQARRRGRLNEAWRRAVRRPLRELQRRLRGNVDTSRIFDQADDLARCYREWTAFAQSIVCSKPGSRLIHARPHLAKDRTPTFVIDEAPLAAFG